MNLEPIAFTCTRIFRQTNRRLSGKVVSGVGPNEHMKSIRKFCIPRGGNMREERTIQLAQVPIGGKDGFLWNRLHGEREELCERLLKDDTEDPRKKLQARLR